MAASDIYDLLRLNRIDQFARDGIAREWSVIQPELRESARLICVKVRFAQCEHSLKLRALFFAMLSGRFPS